MPPSSRRTVVRFGSIVRSVCRFGSKLQLAAQGRLLVCFPSLAGWLAPHRDSAEPRAAGPERDAGRRGRSSSLLPSRSSRRTPCGAGAGSGTWRADAGSVYVTGGRSAHGVRVLQCRLRLPRGAASKGRAVGRARAPRRRGGARGRRPARHVRPVPGVLEPPRRPRGDVDDAERGAAALDATG